MRFLVPKRKAESISNGIFLILLGFLFYTNAWWPGILIAIGIVYAIRQYLTGRKWSLMITLGLIGVILMVKFLSIAFSLLLPLVFIAIGANMIYRECIAKQKQTRKIDKHTF
jgi:hypothetical protein